MSWASCLTQAPIQSTHGSSHLLTSSSKHLYMVQLQWLDIVICFHTSCFLSSILTPLEVWKSRTLFVKSISINQESLLTWWTFTGEPNHSSYLVQPQWHYSSIWHYRHTRRHYTSISRWQDSYNSAIDRKSGRGADACAPTSQDHGGWPSTEGME